MPLRLGIGLVLLILLGYGGFKALPLLEGPTLVVTSPKEGETFADGFVRIQGTALHTENLALNGGTLLIDESGHFSTVLVVAHGGAILSLTATDRFGKTETVRRTIFVP